MVPETIAFFEFFIICACLHVWFWCSLRRSGCGYERHYSWFLHFSLVLASLYEVVKRIPGAERPYWLFYLSALCSLFSVQPINTSLCPSLSIDKSLRSNAFLYCCQSNPRYDFVFSSFDTRIQRNRQCKVYLKVCEPEYLILFNLGFEGEIASS